MTSLFFCILLFQSVISAASSKPNFIVFLVDDMGYGDSGFAGHPTIRTPNIDKLAAEGYQMKNFYVSYSICSPSRASLLTGRYPIRNGVYTNYTYPLDSIFRVFLPWSLTGLTKTELTIPHLLRPQGYRSMLIGKWHLGHYDNHLPTQSGGFDEFFGLPYSQDEGCPPGLGMPCSPSGFLFKPTPLYRNTTIIQQPVNLQTLTPRYNEEALQFMERSVAAEEPFFLEIAYDEVHVPLFTSPKFANVSRRGIFGDAMAEVDDSIGQIMGKLQDLKIDEDTVVLFTSDNGPWLELEKDGGSAGLFRGGKGSTWEGGFRVPCVFRWPGRIAAGVQNDVDIASTMDLLPTFLDFADIPLPSDVLLDGVTLSPALLNTTRNGDGPGEPTVIDRDSYIFYRGPTIFAVRFKNYKMHFHTQAGFSELPPIKEDPPLLFNLDVDPQESTPLPTDTTLYAEITAEVKSVVDKHQSSLVKGPPQLNYLSQSVGPCCGTDCSCGNGLDLY